MVVVRVLCDNQILKWRDIEFEDGKIKSIWNPWWSEV